jgi:hypothetical protein
VPPHAEVELEGQTMIKMMELAPEQRREPAAVAGRHVRRPLVAQWYTDARGVLAMRWITEVEVELDEGNPSADLAA